MVLLGVLAAFEHQLHQGVELGVGVLRVIHVVGSLAEISVCVSNAEEISYPVPFLQHHPGQTVRASSSEAGWAPQEAFVHDCNLQEVFRQGSSLEVVVVGLADTSQETHWTWPTQLELQHAEHEAFGLEDLIDGVPTIDHVNDLLDRRTIDLFVLGSDEDGSGANELQFTERHNLAG